MIDKMQHDKVSLDARVDIIHAKIDYLMRTVPYAIGLINTVSTGNSKGDDLRKSFITPMKDIARDMEEEIGKIIEREAKS